MKRVLVIIFALFLFGAVGFAEFNKMSSGNPVLLQQGEHKHWCPVCGMNLKMYYKTNHFVKLKNGENRQYCSIRCLASDYDEIKEQINEILVVDADTEKIINAKSAFYLVGSKIPGTMSMVSKLAFESKASAEKFQKENGGEIKSFPEALDMALSSLLSDVAMSYKKKSNMMYPMGKKLYESLCKEIPLERYARINILKSDIPKYCGNFDEKKSQAVALYLWEVKRLEGKNIKTIEVTKKDKCPVCGMFVYKYPNWVAEVVYDGGRYLFDGPKDMFKLFLNSEKYNLKSSKIKELWVTDYYNLSAVDAKHAFFVVGSNVYGPMGRELVPFGVEADAKNFLKDHGGKILKFDEVDEGVIKGLDN